MGQYYKSLSVAATIMISNKFPIIAEQVAVIFMTSLVTIATVLPVKNTLNFPFKCLQLKNESGDPHFLLLNNDKHVKTQLFAKLKKILRSGFRATSNFRKFKVALKPLRRIFFNFAKSCVLTCLSLFNNKKWGSPDSFLSYKHLKGKLRVFLTGKTVAIVTSDVMKMTATCSAMIGNLFDILIVAATDKDL